MKPLLTISDLSVSFPTKEKNLVAVDNLHLRILPKKTLGLIGESGCGKSTLALAIMRLLPKEALISGTIKFEDRDLLALSDSSMRNIRGNKISMIFQDPRGSLNPVFTIGSQIEEAILAHRKISKSKATEIVSSLLKKVGMGGREKAFSHSLSGGMCQRALISCAISTNPKLLIADEPTTALDVTIQAQILSLLRELSGELEMSLLLITHDLSIIAGYTDDVAVMYAGQIVEYGSREAVFEAGHPYTKALISSIPKIGKGRIFCMPGESPDPLNLPLGCRFASRCCDKEPVCLALAPELREVKDGHFI
ncbi:MAG: ABC transporter ATP-binding protein, partial [bacterium]|nr:ABC transporter ATP-binding protein [bacterium]